MRSFIESAALAACVRAGVPQPNHRFSGRARVRRLRTSLPPLGSEIASAASLRSPGVPKHSGAHRSICSGNAACPMADNASAGMTMTSPIPA
jgi:hypothetical protein